jgi:hypothetical protein
MCNFKIFLFLYGLSRGIRTHFKTARCKHKRCGQLLNLMKRFLIIVYIVLLQSCSETKTVTYNGRQYSFKKQAIKLNDKALKIMLDDPEGNIDYATELLAESINVDSTFFTAYLNKINFEFDYSKYKHGLETARAFVHKFPDNRVGIMKLGVIEEKNGNHTDANIRFKEYFEKTMDWIGKNPNRVIEGKFDLAIAYYLLGDVIRSEQLFNEVKDDKLGNTYLEDIKTIDMLIENIRSGH